jgi:uncharacterized protein (DUF2384 family)
MSTTEGLIQVLGGPVVLKQRIRTVQDLDRLVQSGLPFQALEQVMGRFQLGRAEVEKVLSLPSRTLARRKETARMRANESDRLIRVWPEWVRTRLRCCERKSARQPGCTGRTEPWGIDLLWIF